MCTHVISVFNFSGVTQPVMPSAVRRRRQSSQKHFTDQVLSTGIFKCCYKGRLIIKLQNSIILLVFQILKIRCIRFVGNLILSSSCEFYYDDITVTSFINITYGDVATEIFP